jgi:hypothetical protein
MAEKDEVLDVILLLAAIGNGVGKATEDGKITISDFVHLGPAALKLPAALTNIKDVDNQIGDATPEQVEAWKQAFISEFDIADDKAEAMVEDYLRIVADLAATIKKHHFADGA